jgi:hypothetical protein
MKDIKEYILEGRNSDIIKIKNQNGKEVKPVWTAYDDESLTDLVKKYKYTHEYWIDKGFFLAKLKNKSTWEVNMKKEFSMNDYQPNGEFLKCKRETYTEKEISDMLKTGEIMLIVLNK